MIVCGHQPETVKIISEANLGPASADSRNMADMLEFMGGAVERESSLPKFAQMNLERGEQFRKLGTKSLWSVEETLGLGVPKRKTSNNNSSRNADLKSSRKQAKSGIGVVFSARLGQRIVRASEWLD